VTGTPCVLATVVACEPPTSARSGDKAVVTADGRLFGWVGGSCSEPIVRREALRALAEKTPRVVRIVPAANVDQTGRPGRPGELTMATTCPSGGSLEIFVEPRIPRPLLVVIGGSPAARTLVQLGALMGFRTCAVHVGARSEDFSAADLVLPTLDLAPARPGPDTWAVVATMGHYDEDALEAALAHPEVHVALVASDRRGNATIQLLRERGLDDATLARVRFPAGGVRGDQQEEIALFALTEIVSARRAAAEGRPRQPVETATFATDPVCGMPVDVTTALHRAVRGETTFYFCGAGCLDRFEQGPELYLAGNVPA
jgi:xanthine dehydrogenase accessory factor